MHTHVPLLHVPTDGRVNGYTIHLTLARRRFLCPSPSHGMSLSHVAIVWFLHLVLFVVLVRSTSVPPAPLLWMDPSWTVGLFGPWTVVGWIPGMASTTTHFHVHLRRIPRRCLAASEAGHVFAMFMTRCDREEVDEEERKGGADACDDGRQERVRSWREHVLAGRKVREHAREKEDGRGETKRGSDADGRDVRTARTGCSKSNTRSKRSSLVRRRSGSASAKAWCWRWRNGSPLRSWNRAAWRRS